MLNLPYQQHVAKVISSKATRRLASKLEAAQAHIEDLENKLYRFFPDFF